MSQVVFTDHLINENHIYFSIYALLNLERNEYGKNQFLKTAGRNEQQSTDFCTTRLTHLHDLKIYLQSPKLTKIRFTPAWFKVKQLKTKRKRIISRKEIKNRLLFTTSHTLI